MTERWKTQLERLDRLSPSADLIERAQQRPPTPLPKTTTAQRIGTIVVAGVLTIALAVGGLVLLRDRSTPPPPSATNEVPSDPENGDLLFAASGTGGWNIFALDPDGGEPRQLTDGVRDYDSDPSPDGTKIVYDSETRDGYAIVVADADGANPVVVAQGESPSWSPDGARIAYSNENDGAIWVVNVDGSDAHPITDPTVATSPESDEAPYDWNAAWSPDGTAIAYTRYVSGKFVELPSGKGQTSVTLEELRVWRDDGTDVVLTDEYTYLGDPDWSPDGSTIVFAGAPTLFHEEATDGMAWPRLMTIPSTGGEATPITPDRKRWIAGATWSPDGEWIAFQDDYETIAIVRPDGSDRREIPFGDEVIGLSWGAAPADEVDARSDVPAGTIASGTDPLGGDWRLYLDDASTDHVRFEMGGAGGDVPLYDFEGPIRGVIYGRSAGAPATVSGVVDGAVADVIITTGDERHAATIVDLPQELLPDARFFFCAIADAESLDDPGPAGDVIALDGSGVEVDVRAFGETLPSP